MGRIKHVEDRLYAHHKLSQKQLSQKVAKLHNEECPFRPSINKSNIHRDGNIWDNLYNESKISTERLQKKKLNFSVIDDKELTFTPQMVAKPKVEHKAGPSLFEHLYQDTFRLREAKKEQVEKSNSEFTFTPEIHHTPAVSATPFDQLAQPKIVKQAVVQSKEEEDLKECTFHPKLVTPITILQRPKTTSTSLGDIKQGTYDRLYKDARRHHKQREKMAFENKKKKLPKEYTFHPKITSSTHKPDVKDCFERLSKPTIPRVPTARSNSNNDTTKKEGKRKNTDDSNNSDKLEEDSA